MGNLCLISDAEEKKEVKASNETDHHSASYTEEGSDEDKVKIFVDDHQLAQPAVQIEHPQQAVCKFVFIFKFCSKFLRVNLNF